MLPTIALMASLIFLLDHIPISCVAVDGPVWKDFGYLHFYGKVWETTWEGAGCKDSSREDEFGVTLGQIGYHGQDIYCKK